jgi:hypothetical protein
MTLTAVDHLRRARRELEERCAAELSEIDKAIIRVNTGSDNSSKSTQGRWTPKKLQYDGFKPAVALQAYLSQQNEEWNELDLILEDLRAAGVRFAKEPKRDLRHLKITISNNGRIFELNKEGKAVRLIRLDSA